MFDYPGNPPETKEHIERLIEILKYNSAPFYIFNVSYEYYIYEIEEIKEDYQNIIFKMVDDMKLKQIKKVLLTNDYMQPDVYDYVLFPLMDDFI